MKRLIAAITMAAFLSPAAFAEPLTGGALEDRIAGSELRFSGPGYHVQFEHHLYRFRPDGRAEGQIHFTTTGRWGRHFELYDTGRWYIAGADRVCIDWDGDFYWHRNNQLCFTIEPRGGAYVAIATDGGRRYLGTLHPWGRN